MPEVNAAVSPFCRLLGSNRQPTAFVESLTD